MVITGKYWLVVLIVCGASVAALAASQALTEAPAGFDTPTLVVNPGSQSVSNGIAEPVGDSFALDQRAWAGIQRAGLLRLSSKPGQRGCQPVHRAARRPQRCERQLRQSNYPHR